MTGFFASLAMMASAALPTSGTATFRCVFDEIPGNVATMPTAQQAAWADTKDADGFDVSFPWANPADLKDSQLFAFRGDSLAGYTVSPGKRGPLSKATGPTEMNRLFWPDALRMTMEVGKDYWLWIELVYFDAETGSADFRLYRQNRPAEIKAVWQVTGSCVDPTSPAPTENPTNETAAPESATQ